MDSLSLASRVKERRPVYYLPVNLQTLGVITRAEDENFQLFAVSVELVEVACLITAWTQTTMKCVLGLQDHTGSFTGVIYTRNDEKLPMCLRGFNRDCGYASVFGRVMKFADQPLLSVLKIRNIDYAEVMAHRVRALHLVCSLAKKQGNAQKDTLKTKLLQAIESAKGITITALAKKLKESEDVLRSVLFSLLEAGRISMRQNLITKS